MRQARTVFLASAVATLAILCGGSLSYGAQDGGIPGATAGADRSNPIGSLVVTISDVSSADAAMDLYIGQLDRIAGALEQVKDDASANLAAASIDETVQEMEGLSAEIKGKITSDEWLAAITQRQQELTQVQSRISMAMMQIVQKDPALMQRMNESMSGLPTIGN